MKNLSCPHCKSQPVCGHFRKMISKFGHFYRNSDRKYIQRYRCLLCRKHFSQASFDRCYWQRKRQFNERIFRQLASGTTQRRTALILELNRKTVVRKFLLMSELALSELERTNQLHPLATNVQFDDLETYEHTKCKPLSVGLVVVEKTRRILGFYVARMPAKGTLVKKSLKKYGLRPDERAQGRAELFTKIQKLVHPQVVIKSDQNPHYPKDVRRYLPAATHITYKGRKPASAGQGELKEGGYDPLFSLNHTFAKMRADIARLIRETWTTTKKPERLFMNIALMAHFHNQRLKTLNC